ncbi:hypothetical protein CRM22_004899 [Opisthorchis felineus]|uniref:Adenosine 3'-phospho 5'-phosphosulfate transporter 1 n=1 Tax=Opisthorchis felineus TaxID=147828 RepID=A0A4S2LZG1_OPIFE|nr:hypothetical protein CRM22_004899 [Opisthorchis felineus]
MITVILQLLWWPVGATSVNDSAPKSVIYPAEKPFGWVLRLLLNSAGYLAILLPLFAFRAYLTRVNRMERLLSSRRLCLPQFVRICFTADVEEGGIGGSHLPLPVTTGHTSSSQSPMVVCLNRLQSGLGLDVAPGSRTSKQHYLLLGVCALGLQTSYVLWGIMQERIMTRTYDGEMFHASQYLVFCNRLATVLFIIPIHFLPLGLTVNPIKEGRRAPFFEFSFASFSNILSSWCQYEALKYVSFPTQVLSKACKVVPVMLMGTFVQRRSYSLSEYLTAGMISFGLSLFLLSDPEKESNQRPTSVDHVNSISGTFLIVSYVLLDSFTSNWQDRLFQRYALSSVQVMAAVNFWSVLLTLIPLVQQGDLLSSIRFGLVHPEFNLDVLLSAVCSATGQLFIFLTIQNFGPASFVLIMTLRMALSILISCLLFSHPLSPMGIFGVILVFVALFFRMHLRSKHAGNSSIRQSTVPPFSLRNEEKPTSHGGN